MIEPNIYCKVCGMTMQCVHDSYKATGKRPLVLEIGAAEGDGVRRYAGFCDMVIAVDAMMGGRPDIYEKVESGKEIDTGKRDTFLAHTKSIPGVQLVTGCSLWPSVKAKVEEHLSGRKLDILVIDGCHHPFEAVWDDFTTYQGFVRSGGFIVFDDLYEECILKAYNKARDEFGLVEHERWTSKESNVKQDCGALRKL